MRTFLIELFFLFLTDTKILLADKHKFTFAKKNLNNHKNPDSFP